MKKKIKKSVQVIGIIFLIFIIVFCGFQIYRTIKQYSEVDELNEEFVNSMFYEVEDDTQDEDEDKFIYDHQAALAINSDALGLLYIPATGCMSPIVQTTDNNYYLKHAFDRSYSYAGCLFVDYRCKDALDSDNVIIYGHNMRNLSMFGSNKQLMSKSLYEQEGNNVFYIYGDGYVRTYLIYMVGRVAADANNFIVSFDSQDELVEYAQRIQALSNYDTGVDVSDATQIVTLSTCTTYGAKYSHRLFIQGMLIQEEDTETGEITTY